MSEPDECCPRRDVSSTADRHVDFKSLPWNDPPERRSEDGIYMTVLP